MKHEGKKIERIEINEFYFFFSGIFIKNFLSNDFHYFCLTRHLYDYYEI